MSLPEIDGEHLLSTLAQLGRLGGLEGGGVCRLALTDEDKAGRDWVVGQMRELGMQVTVDGIGNVVGLHAGREDLPPVSDWIPRHALHAAELSFQHPISEDWMTITAPLPADFSMALERLRVSAS